MISFILLTILSFSSSTVIDSSSTTVMDFDDSTVIDSSSTTVMDFDDSTVIDSSSTTTECRYDRIGRCYIPQQYDFARFFDMAEELSPPVQTFTETVQITNSSEGSILQQDTTQKGGGNSLDGYFRTDGSRIADEPGTFDPMYCQKPYDVLFSQCEYGN